MLISHNWLLRYIKHRLTPEQLSQKLIMLGLEVASVERPGEKYKKFVVGQVVERAEHPNANKLSVCKVNVGKHLLQIVCGAPNVDVGQKVAVGLVGAVVPRNQHEGNPFVLSKVQIRGIESSGMICSEYELDLGTDTDGIMILEKRARVGQPLASYLGVDDVVYDIEITPNRPDCMSHIGVAREIGTIIGKKALLPSVKPKEASVPISRYFTVKVEDTTNCPRFAVRIVKGVRVGPSPQWLQSALTTVGLRPRNNVVDVTNFVMLECGQPLHAFDYALLQGNRIVVRKAKEGTAFTTLDGKTHLLPANAVMVCDREREVSIAGIMGGENSEINEATVDVVIEAAYWNPSSIRQTSKRLGISTDASQRFERGADPNAIPYALNRTAELILDLAGGELLKGTIDVYPKRIRPRVVSIRPDRVNAVLGTSLTKKEMLHPLRCLNLEQAKGTATTVKFQIPTYRVDLEREIDLIEEIARVIGYGSISDKVVSTIDFSHPMSRASASDSIRETLVKMGFQEAMSLSMQDARRATLTGETPVEVMNPLGKETAFMRTSLIPGLLDSAAHNQSYGNTSLRLFEIGHVFSVSDSPRKSFVEGIVEDERVALLMTGLTSPRHWSATGREMDIFDLKGEVEGFLAGVGLDKCRFIYYSTTDTLADIQIRVEIHGTYAGYLGRIKKEVLEFHGLDQQMFVAEFNLDSLVSKRAKKYAALPRFPKVARDVAFIVDANLSAENLEMEVRDAGSSLLQSVEVFDVYEGENVPRGKKSVALSLELMSQEKTLTDDEIEKEVERIVRRVEDAFGATWRRS